MDNGRPRGFWIVKAELEVLLDELPDDREIGILGLMTATAADVKRVLSRQDPLIEKLPVEEQEHIEYVVHLGAVNPRLGSDHLWTWLSVREYSPLYHGLRQHHFQRTKRGRMELPRHKGNASMSTRHNVSRVNSHTRAHQLPLGTR